MVSYEYLRRADLSLKTIYIAPALLIKKLYLIIQSHIDASMLSSYKSICDSIVSKRSVMLLRNSFWLINLRVNTIYSYFEEEAVFFQVNRWLVLRQKVRNLDKLFLSDNQFVVRSSFDIRWKLFAVIVSAVRVVQY